MSRLVFDPIKGIGYEPFNEQLEYGKEYFEKYVALDNSMFGQALNSLRIGLVSRYFAFGVLVDIGVGGGGFLRLRDGTFGYDVNPYARQMLVDQNRWCDIDSSERFQAVSFWDSFEHIEQPLEIVKKVSSFCFISIPVFQDREHILKSKHYKPNEHYWYFTRAGLIAWFLNVGFLCLEMNQMETALGREDIETFVFCRRFER